LPAVSVLVVFDIYHLYRGGRIYTEGLFFGMDLLRKSSGCLDVAIVLQELQDLYICISAETLLLAVRFDTYELLD
jgi:hypothetical protein